MKPSQIFARESHVRSQVLLLLAFLFLANGNGTPELAAQSLIIDAKLRQQAGSLIQVRGDLVVHQRPHTQGSVALGGSLSDNAGLLVQEGSWTFNGNGEKQLIQGTEMIHLWDMEIAEGARVVLPASARLTVAGSLANQSGEDGLLLESSETGRASLLHQEAGVMATVQYWLPEETMVTRYLSSPVVEQDIEPAFYQGFDAFGSWYEMMQYFVMYTQQEIFPTFRDANDDVLHFLPAKGYYAQYQPLWDQIFIREFRGPLHQGHQEFRLMVQSHPMDPSPGFNLMGNPYPSPIDWLAEEGWSGREYLVGGDKGEQVMWLWNDSIQNYGAFHPRSRTRSHNGNRGLIQPMDAFWVQAEQGNDGKKIGMDDRVRLHVAAEGKGEGDMAGPQAIRITLSTDQGPQRDEVIVELGHQRPGGAGKKFAASGKAPQLYAFPASPSWGKLPAEMAQGKDQGPCESGSREAGAYSMLLLEHAKEETHIPLVAITRAAGNHSIHLEHDKDIDASVSLVLREPDGTLKRLDSTPGAPDSLLKGPDSLPEGSDTVPEGSDTVAEGPHSVLEKPNGALNDPDGALKCVSGEAKALDVVLKALDGELPVHEGNHAMGGVRSYQLRAGEKDIRWEFYLVIRP